MRLAGAQDLIPSPTAQAVATATVAPTATPDPVIANAPAPPLTMGRVILVSLSRQRLYAYDDGALAFTFTVETGRPELPTPTGVYHIFMKNCSDMRWTNNNAPTANHNVDCVEHNGDGYPYMFYSPWPQGSPNWYYPTHINYAMEFKDGGFFLHDAWWHATFGPGSNTPHRLANGTWETGSHGCVGMPTSDAEQLYGWAATGTTVYIRATV